MPKVQHAPAAPEPHLRLLSSGMAALKRTFALYAALAILSAIYLYPFVRAFNESPDSGVYVNGAYLVAQGAIPSRDFIELQGPGSFLWLALFFRLFGATLQTAHFVLIATGVAIELLVFWISRYLGAKGVQAAVFVLLMSVPLLPINSPHYDSNLFALAAIALFLAAGNDPKSWKLHAAAALCGVTAITMQQKGTLLALALIASMPLLWGRRKAAISIVKFSAVFVAVIAIPLLWFASNHALADVWYANFEWPLHSYSSVNAAPYGFPIWQNLLTVTSRQGNSVGSWISSIALTSPFLLIALLPLLTPLAAKWDGSRWFEKAKLPLWSAAYALWLSEIHRKDIGHLRNGCLLLALLFFAISETSVKTGIRRGGLVFFACLALGGMANFLTSWQGKERATRKGETYVSGDVPLLQFLEKHTHRGEEVFVYPYQPIYYFVEDLRNPTRYSNLTYRFNPDSQFREAANDLERKQVRYVVFDTELSGEALRKVFPAYRVPEKSKLIMEPYLDTHYRCLADLGRFHVLERTK